MAPSAPAVHSVTDLLARAIGIEREAADRYAAFARFMQDRGRDELADLFAQLARLEHDHARVIEEWLGEVNPPVPVEAAFHWLESGPPSPAAHEWLLRLMGPRDALAIVEPTDLLDLRGDVLLELATVLRSGGRAHEARKCVEKDIELYEAKGNVVAVERARAQLDLVTTKL